MSRSSLHTRLNIWTVAMVAITLLFAFCVSEVVTALLAENRRTALLERVHAEVERVHLVNGPHAASRHQVEGAEFRITDRSGMPIGDADSGGSTDLEVSTRLAEDLWLHTYVPDDVVRAAQRDSRIAFGVGGILALLLAFLGGSVVTRRMLSPIDDVTRVASEIVTHGDTGERVPNPNTGDGLDQMVDLFNHLLDLNANMVRTMRESLDNVAHDLRTPLTRIRTSAEIALSGSDPAVKDETLAVCLEESEATERLLTSLLDLTRAEAGMLVLQRTGLQWTAIVDRVVSLYAHVAEDRRISVVHGDGDAPVFGDAIRLQQAVANLLDNALKFTPAGGEVQLNIVEQTALSGVEVRDTGCGIDSEELERIFERLYRADGSRRLPGAGLGLAMVRAIAQAHGGRVEVSSGDTGTSITLWIPKSVRSE